MNNINLNNSANTVQQAPESDRSHEPLAIVGMACRFPGGVASLEEYWSLMAEGRDGICEIPSDRLDLEKFYDPRADAPGKIFVRHGGFLQQPLDGFDAEYFGMSPREAAYLDPQQRLLMEVAFEALDDAGLPVERVRGSNTGVFIGGFMVDGMLTQFSPLGRDEIGQHSAVSSTLTILSNRISYLLDLHGPSFTLDTACSSSLVAMHQACQALRHDDCDMAMVGGVNVIFRPETLIAMCKGGFLSRDGRSKSFDARADGYGRGEGAGVVVLKRLCDAQAAGDRIHAVIRSTGVNQDGRTDGITQPSGDAQAALIRSVCAKEDIDPAGITYVEAHGTGTAIGDPIELRALSKVFGAARAADAPSCLVGSVKANIGHLEAAAGIAAVIKTALCLKHGMVPPVANLEKVNPALDLERWRLDLPRSLTALPSAPNGQPGRAAINSFGYGGTNASLVMERAEPVSQAAAPLAASGNRPAILVLSARSADALRETALAYAARLDGITTASEFVDLCYSAALRRSAHENRLAVVAADAASAAAALRDHANGRENPDVVTGYARDRDLRPAFVFTGMGPQWWGMGRELLASEPAFREAAEEIDRAFVEISGWSILEELARPEAESRVTRTEIAQPANFLIQTSLLRLLETLGLTASAMVGHSVGEVSSAFAAGVLSLSDALRVSHLRAKLQATTAGQGAMLAVGATPAAVMAYLKGHESKVSIAAGNGPASITLAGDAEALEVIAGLLTDDGIFNRKLQVETAYHSPIMDPLLDPLEAGLAGIDPRVENATVPLYSTVSAMRAEAEDFGPAYWRANVRECVRFADTLREMIDDGHSCFLEVGPHPVLSASLRECLQDANVEGVTALTLRRNQPEMRSVLRGLAALHVAGVAVDWARFFKDVPAQYVSLPSYPWQRKTFWNEGNAAREDRLGHAAEATLLGKAQAGPNPVWASSFNRNRMAYVLDHRVEGSVVLPGAAYCEMAFQLAQDRKALGDAPLRLSRLAFKQAMLIGDTDDIAIRTSFDAATRRFAIHSSSGADWMLHAEGNLGARTTTAPEDVQIKDLIRQFPLRTSAAQHYANMQARGLQYGPLFQGVSDLHLSEDRLGMLARIEAPEGLASRGEILHPALLDACFQALIAMLPENAVPVAYVPVRIDEIVIYHTPGAQFHAEGRLLAHDDQHMVADLRLLDDTGRVLAELVGIHARSLGRATTAETGQETASVDHLISRFALEPAQLEAGVGAVDEPLVLLLDRGGRGRRLAAALATRVPVTLVDAHEPLPTDLILSAAHLVDLRGLTAADQDPVGAAGLAETLSLIQSLPQSGERRRLSIVLPVLDGHPDAVALHSAARLGLARVAANEYADLDLRLIQVDRVMDCTDRLMAELLSGSDEDDVVLSAEARLVRRLRQVPAARIAEEAKACRIPGPPGEGMLELEVAAWIETAKGSDVLAVVRQGAGELGQRVLLRLPESAPPRFVKVASAATTIAPEYGTDGEVLALLPLSVAATLLEQAGLQAGQTVALAVPRPGDDLATAVALMARRMDARVVFVQPTLAPARAVLQDCPEGVDLLCLTFAEDAELAAAFWPALAATAHVLDLTGADLLLPPGHDILRLDPGRISIVEALQFAAGLHDPHHAAVLQNDLREIAAGRPAPRQHVLGQADASKAAKAVLTSAPVPQIKASGSYLVTGGFGGFGFEIARWLAQSGAGHIVLAGRRGIQTEGAAAMMAELAAFGANVSAVAVDVADAAAVSRMIGDLAVAPQPLRGIFHAAGVLDDAPVYLLATDQVDRVMGPKAVGAWNLHVASQDFALDAFVVISSIAALLGSPGQGAYVAANTFLDALMRHRRLSGLPGIAVNLGALAEVGMAARHDGVERHFARVGVGSLKPAEAINMLARILHWNPVNLAAASMDWALWGQTYAKWAASPRYRDLMPERSTAEADMASLDLASLSPEARASLVETTMRDLVGLVLRLPTEGIDPNWSLLNMGMDSLMAMELQAGIDRRLGLKIPTLELMKGVPFAALIRNVTASAASAAPAVTAEMSATAAPAATDRGDISAMLAQLEHMSPEEIERTLAQLETAGQGE